MRRARSVVPRGFTLIELMVGLAIAILLLLLAAPGYGRWIADSQIAAAASAMADGIRFAQAEAIKRNTGVEFTVGTDEWHVNVVGSAAKLREGTFAEGAKFAVMQPTPSSSTTVTFNAFGMIEAANANAPTVPLTDVDITMSSASKPTGLRVLIANGAGGSGVRVCDPDPNLSWPADGKACPT